MLACCGVKDSEEWKKRAEQLNKQLSTALAEADALMQKHASAETKVGRLVEVWHTFCT